ncbi:MAG: macrolide ABC transporter ATP-binding protein [Methanobacteriota archaeon]|nr:MAG: macrolide ABC transporter ATP-binding protein [Euryarchaeota archaeon]HIF16547.1 ABC transporter ATP-binding protein [Candidatus Poseidoniales archaeon]
MATVLEGRGLWKIYQSGSNKIEALREISLTIEAGEMVAIMGPSGCGKTTLLNCLSGLDELTAGEVLVEGISLTASDDKHRTNVRGRNLGFIFQSFNLIPVLTAVENVEMPLLLQGIPAKEARQRSLDALDLVGLKNWSTHRPMELSGGQRQRVTIARAFVHEPAVILGDEPTGNLDTRTSNEVMDLLFELNAERGTTLLVVTHDSEIAARCSRILHMEDGLIVRDEKSEEE